MPRRARPASVDTRWVDGATWRLADEIRYIQRRAAEYDSRVVTIGPLLLFSTETGDAWVLDPADRLAMPVAREGHRVAVQMAETDTNFVIGWTGQYRIDGDAFVYAENKSGKIRAMLGYPTRQIAQQSHAYAAAWKWIRSLPAVMGQLLPRRQRSRAARAGRRLHP